MEKKKIPLQIKSLNDREFSGYGSIFGNRDLGGDVVEKGAFKRTLAQKKRAGHLPQMFWGHNPDQVPGKWLDMYEDDDGLMVRGVLADTQLGNEIHTLLKMDAVRGLSIGYVTRDQDWEDDIRIIKDVDLWEVSIVSLPMNPLANIEHVKSRLSAAGEYVPTKTELEDILRKAGFSRRVAKECVFKIRSFVEDDSCVKPDEPQRNADDDVAQALNALAEKLTATAITAKFAK